MGYADIGPFGATAYKTPHLDRMAKEGRIFTDFHSATAVCSASRAALMTGCYPERVSILGALNWNAKTGINDDEMTLAELCKSRGYATAIFGKWHLGHHKQFLPLQHGFDEYFGLPYSNDMSPLQADMIEGLSPGAKANKRKAPPLPLFEGNEIVDPAVTPEKLAQLTTLYTEHAVSFIDRNKDKPFFLYVPHTMVHVPLAVSDKFKGKSGAGLFGDVVMELDWSVGQILDAIKRNGLDDNTLRHLHLRQRPLAQLRQPRRLRRPAARREGHDVGRRLPRAVRHALARQDSRRHQVRRAGVDDRPLPNGRQADRRQSADRSQDRRQRHLAADVRRAGARVRTTRCTATTAASCGPCAIGSSSLCSRTNIEASTANRPAATACRRTTSK